MEGIILDVQTFPSVSAVFGGAILLGLVVAGILLGHAAEEEKRGKRLYWAEWPLPETESPESPVREFRKAA